MPLEAKKTTGLVETVVTNGQSDSCSTRQSLSFLPPGQNQASAFLLFHAEVKFTPEAMAELPGKRALDFAPAVRARPRVH